MEDQPVIPADKGPFQGEAVFTQGFINAAMFFEVYTRKRGLALWRCGPIADVRIGDLYASMLHAAGFTKFIHCAPVAVAGRYSVLVKVGEGDRARWAPVKTTHDGVTVEAEADAWIGIASGDAPEVCVQFFPVDGDLEPTPLAGPFVPMTIGA